MNTPQIDDLIIFGGQIAAAIIAIVGALVLVNKYLFSGIRKDIDSIKKELHPNGGSSLRDAVDRIAVTQENMRIDVSDVREKIDDHIVWHLDN
jgi:hypothetical protein